MRHIIHSTSGSAPTGELVTTREMPENAVGVVEVSTWTGSGYETLVGSVVYKTDRIRSFPDQEYAFDFNSPVGRAVRIRLFAPSEGVTFVATDLGAAP
jgi:hypothetical protein